MKTLLKKEIRLLLPAWIAAMLLAVFPAWITGIVGIANFSLIAWLPDDWFTVCVPLIFALGALFLGISSFGGEISAGAFTILLSQPAERRRIWRVKTATLSIAFASVWLAAVISSFGFAALSGRSADLLMPSFNLDAFKVVTISALITFSGGLWTTLLLRQITMAFWVTLLAPMAICMGAGLILDFTPVSDQFADVSLLIALFFYSLAGFFYARKLFYNAQDVQWTGGEISFQWRRQNAQTRAISAPGKPRHWLAMLVGKEIQLHQANLAIAAVLFALDLGCFFVHKVHPHFKNPDVAYILEIVWIIWLVMPLLIGCTTIAEERKLGVFDSQKCLPVSRSTQFFVKFSIALILSLLLGGLIPFLFFKKVGDVAEIARIIFIIAAAIFFISFYASSLARSTLQAIGFTVLVAAAIVFYEFATETGVRGLENVPLEWLAGLEWLKLFLGSAILIGVLGCLAFWNFKWLHENRKLWRRNLAVALTGFGSIFVLTNGIYFRTWEFFTPPEPSHGPGRISDAANIKFAWSDTSLYVLLPDGRLWNRNFSIRDIRNCWSGSEFWSEVFSPNSAPSQFVGGSNWVAIAGNHFQELGVQSDGSLWSLQKKWRHWNSYWPESTGPITIKRLGEETDWVQITGNRNAFWLLKKEGTLWVWGTNDAGWNGHGYNIPRKLKLDLAMAPALLSTQTNWSRLFPYHAEKKDGSLWSWNDYGTNHGLYKVNELNGSEWSTFIFDEYGGGTFIGVKTNGELSGRREDYIDLLGQNAKWKQANYAGWNSIFAIREDGTLWSCGEPGWDLGKPVQLGDHSDWIALTHNWFSGVALASDGSLWAWNEPSDHFLLAPSRKPVYLGNIFQGTMGQDSAGP